MNLKIKDLKEPKTGKKGFRRNITANCAESKKNLLLSYTLFVNVKLVHCSKRIEYIHYTNLKKNFTVSEHLFSIKLSAILFGNFFKSIKFHSTNMYFAYLQHVRKIFDLHKNNRKLKM